MKHFEKYTDYFLCHKREISLLVVVAICLLPNFLIVFRWNQIFILKVLNILFPCGLYLLLVSLVSRCGYGMLVMLPFMFLSAFQIVLINLYSESVISTDMWLNVSTTNVNEVHELLHSLVKAISIVMVIYVPAIIIGVFAIIKKWTTPCGFRKRIGILSVCLLASSLIIYASVSAGIKNDINKDVFPLNAFLNLKGALKIQHEIDNYPELSKEFNAESFSLNPPTLKECHIVVIGETSRADNWGIFGYERPTTESLKKISNLTVFPKAFSQSNTTHKSVPILLSHIDAKEYGDSIFRIKSVISEFKAAGYQTAFFSNQQRNHSYIDFFGEEADDCIFLHDGGYASYDGFDRTILNLVRDEIEKSYRKLLIVVHTYGSHFSYNERYPEQNRKFTPDNYKSANKKWRKELINAYDNSIVATSEFLADLIDLLEMSEYSSSLIYTSDHGEDIFDDGRELFLHASRIPTYYQLHVPLLIWQSSSFRTLFPDKQFFAERNSDKFVSSSSSLYHTLIDMANLRTRYFKENLSLSNKAYNPPPPMFINDCNDAVLLEKSGISTYDLKKIKYE